MAGSQGMTRKLGWVVESDGLREKLLRWVVVLAQMVGQSECTECAVELKYFYYCYQAFQLHEPRHRNSWVLCSLSPALHTIFGWKIKDNLLRGNRQPGYSGGFPLNLLDLQTALTNNVRSIRRATLPTPNNEQGDNHCWSPN